MDPTGSPGAAHGHPLGSHGTPTGMSALRSLSIDHTTAPLEVLERMALGDDATVRMYHELRRHRVEAVVLSTCNRTALHWGSRGPVVDAAVERLFLDACTGELPTREQLRARQGRAAAEHLFRLAAGLESLVLGEAEILGQVRAAIDLADLHGTSGFFLAALFRAALRAAGLARQETGIGAGALSVVSASLSLVERVHPDLARCTALVVGAGATGRKAAQHLRAEGVGRLVILNRTPARAAALAAEVDAEAAPLGALAAWLESADLAVVAVRAELPLVTSAMVRALPSAAPARPRVLLDLSLPRGVEPACARAPGVLLHDLSSLEAIVERNRARRAREVPRAEALLGRELQVFEHQSRESSLRPVLTELWRMAETIRRTEIARAARAGVPEAEMVEHVTRRIVDRLLHGPSMALRRGDLALDGQHAHYVREMFGLAGEPPAPGGPAASAEDARQASA